MDDSHAGDMAIFDAYLWAVFDVVMDDLGGYHSCRNYRECSSCCGYRTKLSLPL